LLSGKNKKAYTRTYLGVKIISFSDPRRINRPGEDIELTGSIKAASLDDDVKLQVFCYLENYNHDLPVLADVLGGRAEGNEVTLFKGAPTSINFNCLYRGGVPETDMKRPKETRFAKVVVAYQFTTKASERVYFLPRETLDSLDRNNVNPFTQYKVDDPYLKSDRTITSVSTAGPINLGLAVNFPQPLTVNPRSAYQFFVQLSNNPGFSGSLQKIESLELQVPDVPELSISLQGEQGFSFGRGSRCDFEYAGPGEQGFKVYTLSPERLAEVNRECDLKSLKELAISESQCVDLFKTNPLFGCKFVVNKVPQSVCSLILLGLLLVMSIRLKEELLLMYINFLNLDLLLWRKEKLFIKLNTNCNYEIKKWDIHFIFAFVIRMQRP